LVPVSKGHGDAVDVVGQEPICNLADRRFSTDRLDQALPRRKLAGWPHVRRT
jgi:hypothetical protein